MKFAKILALLLIAALAVAGCQTDTTPKGGDKKAGDKKADDKKAGDKDGKKDEHAHGKGPNGGLVFDFGKYHAELTVDHPKKEMTVHILAEDEKTPVPVSAKELTVATKETKSKKGEVVKPMTITLNPTDEKGGKATKFVGTDPGLEHEAEHEGTLFGDINGKRTEGKFKEE